MNFAIKIIINADDFGYSTAVNEAVLRSFQRHLITSTSLMANMPGFEDAVRLVRENDVLQGRVGIHLNLTEGCSLSEDIRGFSKFCHSSGAFQYRRERPLFFLKEPEQKAVYAEIKAQLDRLIEAGIRPSHLDSHHHVHTEWAIGKLVIRLGKEYGIRKVRLTRNIGQQQGYSKRIYKAVYNWYLKGYAGITGTDYFGDIDDLRYFLQRRKPEGKSVEVMVHPLFDETGELVDLDRKDLRDKLRPVIDHRNTISYTDL
jgi:predicted glycoside hydrolase/deacetylase ChbG (UPF0249 family)